MKIKEQVNIELWDNKMKEFDDYIENDFLQEFELLSRISDIDIIDLNELAEISYIYLYGNIDSYDL